MPTPMLKPSIVGYLSSQPGTDGPGEIGHWTTALKVSAHLEGYSLGGIYRDRRGQSLDGFHAMREAIRRREVGGVIVPSLDHLETVPGLGVADIRLLSRSLGVRVVAADSKGLGSADLRIGGAAS